MPFLEVKKQNKSTVKKCKRIFPEFPVWHFTFDGFSCFVIRYIRVLWYNLLLN